jgi:hypothetical protein
VAKGILGPARRCRAVDHLQRVLSLSHDGRILKLLKVVDEHTREALTITVARRIDADALRDSRWRRAWR